ncbi:MAG TPA: MvaI/BcnI family restriction endonuclease [Pyrinomonadaceae bacterium]|jgi:DNA mismatch repair protein MutH|nr:MvaI/BcnI family restriction endonuclease [Pyrinomonadaceae bacterium]
MFSIQTKTLPRAEALARIRLLSGKDLRPLAEQYRVTVWKNGHKNKGWAGQVIEQYLGLPQNSLQAPDFGSWELKVVPLRRSADGTLRVKESMAITMIEPTEVVANEFTDSHLYDKLRSMIVVARIFENVEDTASLLHSAAEFDLDNPAIREQVEKDYEAIREIIRVQGFEKLTADTGKYVQSRTKGRGHGSISRAFYARALFVAHILNLQKLAGMPKVFVDRGEEWA